MPLVRVTPPADLPVGLDDLKTYLRIDHDVEDELLLDLAAAATARLDGRDGHLGRCLIAQTWRLTLSGFPATIRIPLPPCRSVEAITYVDVDGAARELATADYVVDGLNDTDGAIVRPADGRPWPATGQAPDSVGITFTAGYGAAAADVPADIRAAILLHVGTLYENRGSVIVGPNVAVMPNGYHDLVRDHRAWAF